MTAEPSDERVMVFLGLPANMKGPVGAAFGGMKLKYITLSVTPKPEFEQKTDIVVNTLYQVLGANDGKQCCVMVLPYKATELEPKISEALSFFEELGVVVRRPVAGTGNWPARPPRFDERFRTELMPAMRAEIEAAFKVPTEVTVQEKAAYDIVRGLIAKDKMGKGNNHSHWDDMWSSRGQALGPGDRDKIVGELTRNGILGSKSNKSAGGTGMVFWVADVDKALARFPALADLLGRRKI